MAAKTHLYKVEMTCEGCSGAVERVLNKLKGKGVEDINIDLKGQQVSVTATMDSEELLTIIKKTGKTTTYIGEKS
ncbi:copper transport protein ATOX1-like [Macrosteles quadrilineatus]|uniref:copper transport protein ATOX1-like n=1 Tax=Macrosteles quadrilineatus TaxID=74068 RepID=UPI0023E2ACFE|nr:copper transport protein ATOX1-like [Macrosteles quadrilineatus]XP_054269082.1 copper transport protein ATOX1-like [Macrosteles quadrilineatus]XP_054269721.1 copper transport protein ATOX1-like [Macrosteles quadrilineatus]XP_054269722.1 copper transport protein ATOX1-like [Macrosteles quadrilineatus]